VHHPQWPSALMADRNASPAPAVCVQ
jgi:hypothetical protein